jgi:hypothetical protein
MRVGLFTDHDDSSTAASLRSAITGYGDTVVRLALNWPDRSLPADHIFVAQRDDLPAVRDLATHKWGGYRWLRSRPFEASDGDHMRLSLADLCGF